MPRGGYRDEGRSCPKPRRTRELRENYASLGFNTRTSGPHRIWQRGECYPWDECPGPPHYRNPIHPMRKLFPMESHFFQRNVRVVLWIYRFGSDWLSQETSGGVLAIFHVLSTLLRHHRLLLNVLFLQPTHREMARTTYIFLYSAISFAVGTARIGFAAELPFGTYQSHPRVMQNPTNSRIHFLLR